MLEAIYKGERRQRGRRLRQDRHADLPAVDGAAREHHLGDHADRLGHGPAPGGSWDGSFDHLASYSNFGQSAIQFAAPGGDFVYPGNENCLLGGLVRPCWVFDLVLAPGTGGPAVNGNFFAAGTSMAAPHAAGVAAIIIGKNGGDMIRHRSSRRCERLPTTSASRVTTTPTVPVASTRRTQ